MRETAEPIIFRDEQTIKFSGGGVAYSVLSRDHKNEQCVLISAEGADHAQCVLFSFKEEYRANEGRSAVHRQRTDQSASK